MKDTDVPLLIEALRGDATQREAAIARLTIVGKRAVGGLVETYQATSDRALQIAILRVLEASGDARVLGVVQHAIAGRGDLAIAGIAVLRELLGRRQGSTEVEALDLLLAIARDPSSERRVRAAAVRALDNAPEDVRQAVGALGWRSNRRTTRCGRTRLPATCRMTPGGLRDAIPAHAATAPLADLQAADRGGRAARAAAIAAGGGPGVADASAARSTRRSPCAAAGSRSTTCVTRSSEPPARCRRRFWAQCRWPATSRVSSRWPQPSRAPETNAGSTSSRRRSTRS